MQYLKGGTLYNRITSCKALCEKASRKIMLKLLTALVFLHKRRIVHRDLKLENLVFAGLGDDDSITIVDFGISK